MFLTTDFQRDVETTFFKKYKIFYGFLALSDVCVSIVLSYLFIDIIFYIFKCIVNVMFVIV